MKKYKRNLVNFTNQYNKPKNVQHTRAQKFYKSCI